MFTDAAVAIALTLLAKRRSWNLAQTPGHHASIGVEVLSDHAQDSLSFVVSFIVVSSLWSVHRGLWEVLDDDGLLFALNSYCVLDDRVPSPSRRHC